MRSPLVTGAVLLFVALAFALTCSNDPNDSAPGDPNELHPNSTSPDEQGESGSLVEPEKQRVKSPSAP